MRGTDSSPPSSPLRKRQRLSSPTYDEQLDDISQDDIEAFDAIEAKLSQGIISPRKSSQSNSQEAKERRARAIAEALSGRDDTAVAASGNPQGASFNQWNGAPAIDSIGPRDDPDNPFITGFTSGRDIISKPSAPIEDPASFRLDTDILGFQDHPRSPSPEDPPERDYSSWFEPEPALPPLGFQTAKFVAAPLLSSSATAAPVTGFMKASNKGWIAPSVAALAKAEEKMKEIWQEEDQGYMPSSQAADKGITFGSASNLPSPQRPALRAVENALSPNSPSPSGFSRPSVPSILSSFASPSLGQLKGKGKPFKSPLLNPPALKNVHIQATSGHGFASSPLNPHRPAPNTFIAAGSHRLMSTPVTTAPQRVATTGGPLAFTTPIRPLRITGGSRNTPGKFTTPFKTGMKPGEPGRIGLGNEKAKQPKIITSTTPVDNWLIQETTLPRQALRGKENAKEKWKVFDLSKPPNRRTLSLSGLVPQSYSTDELESMGINVMELRQITPNLAIYYSFHSFLATPQDLDSPSTQPIILGPAAALEQLLERGCHLATKPWVDNHWCLILWKLAGMVLLDPERENDVTKKRWCWAEVMRQLLYRYERELNGGSRPALRLIATQDAPASSPMVLCVSNITWSDAGTTDDGLPIEPQPGLEVTDGWYRLLAQVDQPLARAIRKGHIRIGRKITVAGARLLSERKEPTEILEGYNSIKLALSGNSSHMAAWHARLGFQTGPCIATLNSLTADGGIVAAMDVVVIKTFPVAFLEFIEEDGKKRREGPRSENEETSVDEKWRRRREMEESKLRVELEKRLNRYEGYADRLERKAGARFHPGQDDSPPDHIENLYEELEDPADANATLSRLNHNEAGWLAQFIRERIEKDRDRSGEEIEGELKSICPPREVRNFRVLIVQDACTCRRPANRTAQLTVWDVLGLSLSEGSAAGAFEVGHRFLVTNLMPTQQTAWMDCEFGSEVYLSTRRDSRWTKMKC